MTSYPANAVSLVLGVPIDNLTLESAVQQILALADAYRRDGRPRQIATVNVDFLTNALGWTPWAAPRHPELLEILRRADCVTADGMPVVWLARILGTPLRGRVTGADLVPALASAMAQSGHRLFLLGGRGDIGQQAANKMQQQNPGLQIAGVYSPFVHTEGPGMLDAETDDASIVESINRAEPDVLLIGFGNPKQEIWFHRNRHRLKAGVSIGVGGTFEFIVGRVARAPEWMQRSGLEWIFRITQDPGRLWKRYAIGLLKIAVMGMPLALYYRWQRLRYPVRQSSGGPTLHLAHPGAPASEKGEETVLVLPERVDADWVETRELLNGRIAVSPASRLAVDFAATRFIDASALGYLVRFWKSAQNAEWSVRSVGLERTPVASLLKMTRAWDVLIENSSHPPIPTGVAAGFTYDGLITFADPVAGVAIACLNGRLDVDRAESLNRDVVAAALGDGDCVLDLSALRFIDSTGLRLVFELQRGFNRRGRELILCSLQPQVRQMLDITRLTDQCRYAANREEALGLIATGRSKTSGSVFSQDYRAVASPLDRFLQILFVAAYRAEMAVNFLIRPRVDGAYVAVWQDGRVLLILNSYKSRYTLPCGKIRSGEDPLEAARRELREEVGLDLERNVFRKTFTTVERSEFKEDHIHLFETHLDQPGKICPDGREVIWAGFRTPEEAVMLPLFPPVKIYLLDRMGHVSPNPV